MAIARDSVTTGVKSGGGANSTLSILHTCVAGTTILLVPVGFNDSNQNNNQTASVDYNGTALTQLAKADSGAAKDTRAEIWYLLSPTTGSSLNVNIKYSNINAVMGTCISYTGTSTSAPTISTNTTGTASTASNNITTVDANSLVIDCISCESSPTLVNTGSPTATSQAALTNQSFQWATTADKFPVVSGGSVTMGYSNTSGNTWSYVQAVISPTVSVATVTPFKALLGVGI